jgi:hypothetical protein
MSSGELRGFGCGFGVGVRLDQGKVAEYEAEAGAEVFLDALDGGVCVFAMRALVVAVFDESYFGVFGALGVIFGRDGYF